MSTKIITAELALSYLSKGFHVFAAGTSETKGNALRLDSYTEMLLKKTVPDIDRVVPCMPTQKK